MRKIQLKVIVDKVSTTADGGVKISFLTDELTGGDASILFDFRTKQGYMLFAEQEVKEEDLDVPEVDTEFPQDKSPSQRLRNALYVFWSEQTNKTKTFEELYKAQMEKIIDRVKEKLN